MALLDIKFAKFYHLCDDENKKTCAHCVRYDRHENDHVCYIGQLIHESICMKNKKVIEKKY